MRISLAGRCAIAMLLTAAAATACGGSGGSGSSGVTVTTTVTETATATGGSTGGTGSAAPCAASDLLPVLKAKMDGSAEKYTIVKVKVVRCQNDYAFVIAVPDRSVCQEGVADCYDSAQVFLSWDGTHWNIFNTGTDIGCTSLPLDDQTLVACKALGYPIVTTTTFKMPSGNIGCALLGTTLRCDIRSGLKPPPAKACAGDWTGAVLAATGRRSRAARATRSTTTRLRCSTTGRPGAKAVSRACPARRAFSARAPPATASSEPGSWSVS